MSTEKLTQQRDVCTEEYADYDIVDRFKDLTDCVKHESQDIWSDETDVVALMAPNVEDFGGRNLDVLSTNVKEIEYDTDALEEVNVYRFISENNESWIHDKYLELALSILGICDIDSLADRVAHNEDNSLYPIQIYGNNGWSVLVMPRTQY